MLPLPSGSASSLLRSIQPRSASRSSEINKVFPANAEVEEYGELPIPSGLSGSTCHTPWRAAARKSTNSWAAGPKSPAPPREGSEVGCSRIPEARSSDISHRSHYRSGRHRRCMMISPKKRREPDGPRCTHITSNFQRVAVAGKPLPFVLIDDDLMFLLQPIAQVYREELPAHLPFAIKQLLPGGFSLGRQVGRRRRMILYYYKDGSIGSVFQGIADLSGLHLEGD